MCCLEIWFLVRLLQKVQSERTQGFAADPVYVKGEVFAYVGLSQNLKDLKAPPLARLA